MRLDPASAVQHATEAWSGLESVWERAPLRALPVRFMSWSWGHMEALPHAAGSVPVSALPSRRSSVSCCAQPLCALNTSGSGPLRAHDAARRVYYGPDTDVASKPVTHHSGLLLHWSQLLQTPESSPAKHTHGNRKPSSDDAQRKTGTQEVGCAVCRLGVSDSRPRLSRLEDMLRYLRLGQAQGAAQPSGCTACGDARMGRVPLILLPAPPRDHNEY